jgi:hypothetical protein
MAVSNVTELRARKAHDAVVTTDPIAAVVATPEATVEEDTVAGASEEEEASEVAGAGANGEGAIPKAKVIPQCVVAADSQSR